MSIIAIMMAALLVPNPSIVNTHYDVPVSFETAVSAQCRSSKVKVVASSRSTGASFTQYEFDGQASSVVLQALNQRIGPIKSVSSLRLGCVEGGAYIWVSGYRTWTSNGRDVPVEVRAVIVKDSVY